MISLVEAPSFQYLKGVIMFLVLFCISFLADPNILGYCCLKLTKSGSIPKEDIS